MVQLDGPDSEIQLARLAEQRARRAQRSRRRYANMNAEEKVRITEDGMAVEKGT